MDQSSIIVKGTGKGPTTRTSQWGFFLFHDQDYMVKELNKIHRDDLLLLQASFPKFQVLADWCINLYLQINK